MSKGTANINIRSYMMFKHRHEHQELEGVKTIFHRVKDPFDFYGLEAEASYFLFSKERLLEDQVDILQIYVTGLTSALICILNALSKSGFTAPVYLMHYDRDSNSYLPQKVYYEKRGGVKNENI